MSNKYKKTRLIAKARLCEVDEKAKAAIAEDIENSAVSSDNIYVDAQQDLIVVESVLVSTGINKNDDVFLPKELACIHGTGKHKPVNVEHQDEQIVGHMIESFPTDKEGNRIGNDVINDPEKIPSSFDLTNRAVVYAYVFPQLAHEIREKASSNELFVSVEVWYKGYDYLVGDSVVRRNESTAMVFDPVLRINGGTGFVDGAKVGRALRGMLIAGVGLVKNPANEESVIKSVSHEPGDNKEVKASDLIDKFRIGYFNSEEVDMTKDRAGKEEEKKTTSAAEQSEEATEDLDKKEEGVTGKAENSDTSTDSVESEETKEETVESKEEDVEDTDKDSATAKESDIEGQEEVEEDTKEESEENSEETEKSESAEDGETDSEDEQRDSSKDEISELKSKVNELEKSLNEKHEEFEEVVSELREMKKEKTKARRINEVTEKLSVASDKAEKLVDKTLEMDDKAFAAHLVDLLELFGDKATSSEETGNNEDSENKEEDSDVEDAVDKAVENAEKDEKDKVDFTQGKNNDDLMSKFAEAVGKFVPTKQDNKEE